MARITIPKEEFVQRAKNAGKLIKEWGNTSNAKTNNGMYIVRK
jgi:hypothetical protein